MSEKWDVLIAKIVDSSGGVKRIYQPIDHPYFKDWELTQICSDRLEAILGYFGDVEGKEVLDIGCFYGYFSHGLAKQGAQVVGVDISPKKIEICRLLSECYGFPQSNPTFRHTSYQKYLENEKQFDFILFLSQWHHNLRNDMKSAWEDLNLISEHTGLLLLDMNEPLATEIYRERLSKAWKPEIMLERTGFTKLTPLRPSHTHRRMLYALE